MTIHEDIIAAYDKFSRVYGTTRPVLVSDGGWQSSHSQRRTTDFEMLDSIEWDNEPYMFNMSAVFHHTPSGALFYATDSGCSCPSPFENMTTLDLKPITRMQDWLDHVEDCCGDLRRDEEDVRLGRLEEPDYRSREYLSDMQSQLSYITDQSFRVFNEISDHFETHDINADFSVSIVEKEDDDLI